MNKTFFIALMLASGMALAQSSGSMDQSQPSTQQSQPSTQSQPSAQQNPPSTGSSSSGQNSLTGCLKGSDGAWVIVAQGQSTPVKGDSSTLSPHNGHQVQLKGQQASDGSFQVTDVVLIAETCPSQQSDASSGAATGAVQRRVRYITDQNPQSSPSSDQSSNPSGSQTSNPSGQTSNPAGGQTTAPSGTTQPTTPSGRATTPATTGDQTTADQKKLPQTASPLPLLGLLGLGSLVSGLIVRRRK